MIYYLQIEKWRQELQPLKRRILESYIMEKPLPIIEVWEKHFLNN